MTSLVAQMVKRLPTMHETRVQSLGQEDLLEKEMATHSSILAWKVPWMEEPGRLQSMGSQRVGNDRVTSLSFFLSFLHPCKIRLLVISQSEYMGVPTKSLQSCLTLFDPMDYSPPGSSVRECITDSK